MPTARKNAGSVGTPCDMTMKFVDELFVTKSVFTFISQTFIITNFSNLSYNSSDFIKSSKYSPAAIVL